MYHDADLDLDDVDGDVEDGLYDDNGYRSFPTSQGSSAHFFLKKVLQKRCLLFICSIPADGPELAAPALCTICL